jgi:AraC-like DNA-binding protein
MEYAVFIPPPHLRSFVKYFWSLENSKDEVLPPVYKSMAEGYTEIVFSTNGSFREYFDYSGYVLPHHVTHRSLSIGKTIGLFGIRLYPYALQSLCGVASHELINSVHQIDALFPASLSAQVWEAQNLNERLAILCAYLTKCLSAHSLTPIENVVNHIIATNGREPVRHLQHLSGLSERQFERRFKASIGFSPKQFSRIIRFQHSRKKFASQPRISFADLAYQCNYADQSHFIREFKEFSGMSVTEYSALVNKPDSEEARVIKGLHHTKDEPYEHAPRTPRMF